MKRTDETDEEWEKAMLNRKIQAERSMTIADHKKGFVKLESVYKAAWLWDCTPHEAEQRLMRGELPEDF